MDDPGPVPTVLAAAWFLDLAINPALLAGVAASLALLREHARRVLDFPLDDHEEPLPVFRP